MVGQRYFFRYSALRLSKEVSASQWYNIGTFCVLLLGKTSAGKKRCFLSGVARIMEEGSLSYQVIVPKMAICYSNLKREMSQNSRAPLYKIVLATFSPLKGRKLHKCMTRLSTLIEISSFPLTFVSKTSYPETVEGSRYKSSWFWNISLQNWKLTVCTLQGCFWNKNSWDMALSWGLMGWNLNKDPYLPFQLLL